MTPGFVDWVWCDTGFCGVEHRDLAHNSQSKSAAFDAGSLHAVEAIEDFRRFLA